MRITLRIHSGKPDPSYTVADDQLANLRQSVEQLPLEGVSCQPPQTPRLGYRGTEVILPDGDMLLACGEQVWLMSGQTTAHYHDAGRTLEERLWQAVNEQMAAQHRSLLKRFAEQH